MGNDSDEAEGLLRALSIRGPKMRFFGSKLVVRDIDSIAAISRALSSKTRLMILFYTSVHGETDITTLAKALGTTVANISIHVKILAELGLVEEIVVPGKRGARHLVRPVVNRVLMYFPHI